MVYGFTITTGKGEQLNLADYKGKVIKDTMIYTPTFAKGN